MQNVENADIQRVMNLVDLYRTKVGKESQMAKFAKEEKAYWDEENLKAAIQLHEEGTGGAIGIDLSPDMPEEWVKTLRVNDHLLGHFYSVIAGNNADKDVLSQFLADYYDSSVFTPEEEEFLRSHFKEMVNYIIQTPCDDLENVNHHDGKDWQLIPTEVLELIKSRTHIPAGSTIYNPFSGFAQMASLYSDCKFYCEDSYASYNKRWNAFSEKCQKESNVVPGTRDVSLMAAWMKIALYANSIDARVIEDGTVPAKYDSVISFIPRIPNAIPGQAYELNFELPDDPEIVNKIIVSYKNLPEKGNMILILPKEYLWASNSYYSLRPLWEEMIKDESLTEIIQLPWVMSTNLHREDFCIVIAEKGRDGRSTTFVDARFAAQKSERKNFNKILDLKMLEDMFANGGKESETGLRKMVQVNVKELKSEIFVPQIYVVERPFDEECPIPLSTLGTLVSTRIRSLQFDLPEDTPWVEQEDLSQSFKGELDVASIKKAECPNNPIFVEGSEDYSFSKSGKFVDDFWEQAYTKKGHKVYDYRRCIYLDGTKDTVLFSLSQQGMGICIVRATGKAVAVGEGIRVICPKDRVDAISFAALLRLPIVVRQLQAYKDFGLANHLDDILVPSDKRIIIDEVHRLKNEQEAYKKQEELLATKKVEYINEVRMRKHDMGQYIFELVNIEDLMRYYLDNRETEKDFCHQIKNLLDNFRSSLGELSTLLDNLSKEEQFGNPETFNVNEFLSGLGKRHIKDSYRIQYTCDWSSIKKYNEKKQQAELDAINDQMIEEDMKRQAELNAINDQMLEEDMKQQAELDAINDQMIEEDMKRQAELNAINDQMLEEDMKQQAELDAINDQMIEEDMKQQAEIDAINDQMLEEDMKRQAEIDAINDQMLEEDMKQQAELDAIADQMMMADMKQQAELDAIADQMMEEDMKQQAELDAINDQMIKEDIKLQAEAEVPLTVSSVIGLDNGIPSNANMYMPPIYVAPNDFQRLVNNILNNAKRHGFTNPNKKDYVVQINASIDAESGMYQIDFRNNGDPLPEGMNKMRYGIKGEKAGKTAGTGLGGNYVKSFVEYYGGDYDIFMEDGWTVVRICLPIK